jgi:hypothetical protein
MALEVRVALGTSSMGSNRILAGPDFVGFVVVAHAPIAGMSSNRLPRPRHHVSVPCLLASNSIFSWAYCQALALLCVVSGVKLVLVFRPYFLV